VIGYGKLGGRETGYGSDLDLVFVHEDREGRTAGPKALDVQVFYIRLAQRLVHILNTPTALGKLYDVDVRLRPSGNAGLPSIGLAAWTKYQAGQAWTWEHQSLVRARAVTGSAALAAGFDKARREILSQPRDPQQLAADVRTMRDKMRAELDRSDDRLFDLKQGPGGIADIEFMVQYAVLRWAGRHPELLDYTSNLRLLEQLVSARLIDAGQGKMLADAYLAYRERLHRLALQEQAGLIEQAALAEYRRGVAALWEQWLAAG